MVEAGLWCCWWSWGGVSSETGVSGGSAGGVASGEQSGGGYIGSGYGDSNGNAGFGSLMLLLKVVVKVMGSLEPMGLPVLRLGMVAMVRKQGRLINSELRRLSTFQPSSSS
ncbi:hypothetical protein AMTR_s00023p00053150 [Amborella trichopoda]|uniref:Uncharacterized protein n=1 Tax=Amborella trichopoda TaxID=13333 RepID=W1NJ47_AMBTC|nr:hypothetical protein AMTR_s00023p00053150 [Amborella trichopoda]